VEQQLEQQLEQQQGRVLAQLAPVPEQESKVPQLMLAESGQVGLMFLLLELVSC